MKPPCPRVLLAGIACALLLPACTKASPGKAAQATTSSAAPLSGGANIDAASSLTAAFNTEQTDFEALHPGTHLTMVYAGSQSLAFGIQSGAPVDVFASADTTLMNQLIPGWVAPRTSSIFAGNLLEIVVQPGNPKGIHTLADLAKPGVTLVLCAPTVPAGMYGDQALTNAGVTAHPASLELSVTAALTAVETGNADASIVYVTDVLGAGSSVSGVTIPSAQNILATYPIAPLSAAKNPRLAKAFVSYVLSPSGQATLRNFGFLPPS